MADDVRVRRVTKVPIRGQRVVPGALRDRDVVPDSRPGIDVWLAERLLAGMAPKAAVVASGATIALRTAYRWRKELLGLEVVEVAGFRATFAVRRNGPPARLSDWQAA